jgi:hypothetical protein
MQAIIDAHMQAGMDVGGGQEADAARQAASGRDRGRLGNSPQAGTKQKEAAM